MPVVYLLLAALTIGGCSSIPVTVEVVDHAATIETAYQSAVTQPQLSQYSHAVLVGHGLEDREIGLGAAAVLERLAEPLRSSTAWPDHLALAELYCLVARDVRPPEAARYQLDAALLAGEVLFGEASPDRYDPRTQILLDIYEVALGKVFDHYRGESGHPSQWNELAGIAQSYRLRFESDWPVGYFDDFRIADTLRFTGIGPRHRAFGVGTPIVGLTRENTDVEARFYPSVGMVVPATLLLYAGGDDELVLRLADPLADTTTEIKGRRLPLAADFSVALACFLAGLDPSVYGNAGFFTPGNVDLPQGIRVMQPYDPDKTPVVFVHGLWSSPIIWRYASNAILGDPELRQRYQIWIYLYPTGSPLLTNSAIFRSQIEETRRTLDPEGDDFATQDIVLVGHSMGGLLSGTMIRDSGDRLADLVFSVPSEVYHPRIADDSRARQLLFLEPKPYVHRVIFMSTPHGGSSMADSLIGRIGDWLISPAPQLEEALLVVRERYGDIMKPEFDEVASSVDMLSSQDPFLRTLRDLPISAAVRYHTIIGQSEKGPRQDGTDGVVPYESAHLEGAASELVIRSDHSTELRSAAIAELRRILHLHLVERETP